VAVGLLITATALLYVFAIPRASEMLIAPLEQYPPLPYAGPIASPPSGAIVILGGGRYPDAPEYGEDTVSAATLERVRYGARLARRTQLPVLVTGGTVWKERFAEGELMRRALQDDFNVPARWVEGASRTTWENARFSVPMLREAGITEVYVVTHAWHLPRAIFAFEHHGMRAIPAPTSFSNDSDVDPGAFGYWPDARSLRRSYFALHEAVGLLWYRVKAALD
jgi:uncharacterized SAM-binding protein YcdF (DUF218 family)